MAKKDFDKYFEQVCADYHEMVGSLKELEETCANKMVDSNVYDNLKEMIAPLKNNWMTLSYVKYLLDLPTKKQKRAGYNKSQKKLLSHCKTQNAVAKENSDTICSLNKLNQSIQKLES